MLEVKDLTVKYGSTVAVDSVSMDVAEGEIVALLGPSGSGKSSLLRAVLGLEPVAGGQVHTYETPRNREDPEHLRGAFVASSRDLDPVTARAAVEQFLRSFR